MEVRSLLQAKKRDFGFMLMLLMPAQPTFVQSYAGPWWASSLHTLLFLTLLSG